MCESQRRRSSLIRSTVPSPKAVKRLTDLSTARDGQAVDRIGWLFPPSLPRGGGGSVGEVQEGKAGLGLAERSEASLRGWAWGGVRRSRRSPIWFQQHLAQLQQPEIQTMKSSCGKKTLIGLVKGSY